MAESLKSGDAICSLSMAVKSRPSVSPARIIASRLRTWVTRWTSATFANARERTPADQWHACPFRICRFGDEQDPVRAAYSGMVFHNVYFVAPVAVVLQVVDFGPIHAFSRLLSSLAPDIELSGDSAEVLELNADLGRSQCQCGREFLSSDSDNALGILSSALGVVLLARKMAHSPRVGPPPRRMERPQSGNVQRFHGARRK